MQNRRRDIVTSWLCSLALAAACAAEAPVHEVDRQAAGEIIEAKIRPETLDRLGFDKRSPLGVCGSAFGAAHMPRLGLSRARMGVPEFKPDKAEKWLETHGDDFPFSDNAAAVLDAGGQVLGLINFADTARWVQSGDDAYLDIVARCTRNMVAAHRDRIHCWEVINEPDVFSPGVSAEQMAPIVKAAIRGARAADPNCFILSPCPTNILYMETLLKLGIGEMVDGMAFHVYSRGEAMQDVIRDWKKLYRDYGCGDKPVWITETGWRSGVKYAEGQAGRRRWFEHLDDQAGMLVKGHTRMLAEGIEQIVWYNLTDVSDVRAGENFGLLWSAGGPRGRGKQGRGWSISCGHTALKPSGLAGHVFARILGLRPRLKREVPVGVGVRAFEYATKAGPVLVAWAVTRAWDVPFPAGGDSLRVTDLYGGEHTFPAEDGLCRIRVGPDPIYVRGVAIDDLPGAARGRRPAPAARGEAPQPAPAPARGAGKPAWRVSGEPVVRNGWGAGALRVRQPTVLRVGDRYRMWFEGYWGKQDIALAESPDGQTWTPYAHCSPVLHWTRGEGLVGGPAVLRDGDGTYRMWYTFHPENKWGGGRRVGCARSRDGIRWERFGGNPILPAGAEGMAPNPAGLSVVRRDGLYHLWMAGPGIFHATSRDGIDWQAHGKIAVDRKLPGAMLSPNVVVRDGRFVMAFHTYDWDKKLGTVRFATSADGMRWTTGFLPPLTDAVSPSQLLRAGEDWVVFFTRRFEIWSASIPAGASG